MSEKSNEEVIKGERNETLKEVTDAFKNMDTNLEVKEWEKLTEKAMNAEDEIDAKFKLQKTNLPVKPSIWVKIKNVLSYKLELELTPYQQKIEDEINEYLHQEITWKSLKNALFEDVPITFKGKRVF